MVQHICNSISISIVMVTTGVAACHSQSVSQPPSHSVLISNDLSIKQSLMI